MLTEKRNKIVFSISQWIKLTMILISFLFLAAVCHAETIKILKKSQEAGDFYVIYNGSFANKNTIQTGGIILNRSIARPDSPDSGFFADCIFNGRTGDNTFELLVAHGFSANSSYDSNYSETIKVYFDKTIPLMIMDGIMLKMIDLKGNSLTYQLIMTSKNPTVFDYSVPIHLNDKGVYE